MKYTEEMILHSASGYSMPFAEKAGKEVELSLGYGEQRHPESGQSFFHHGVDFNVHHYLLTAIASGTVCGIGSDSTHGLFQTIRYGKYEVTYRHLANVFANFGQTVKAGQTVALSGDLLHMEVRFDGEELNPVEFLTMIYGNIQALRQAEMPDIETFEMNLSTAYEADRKEIEELMLRYLPFYMEDLSQGQYTVPEHTELSLRNIFSVGAAKKYFFECMPSMSNPLGIGQRSMPLACKVQNLLIADFLNYLALRHNIFLSTLSDPLKKKHEPMP